MRGVGGRPYLVELFSELIMMLSEHPLNGPSNVGDRRNELPKARRAHRDEKFARFSVALDADFDFDCRPYDRRASDDFCFHVAPPKTVAYARAGEMCTFIRFYVSTKAGERERLLRAQ